jgi:hypothetical protein
MSSCVSIMRRRAWVSAARCGYLSVCLAAGLAATSLGSHPGEAAGLAVPMPTARDGIMRVQTRPDPELPKQQKKRAPRPVAPGAPSQPKGRLQQDRRQEADQPPGLVRCPGPSPECPPSQM